MQTGTLLTSISLILASGLLALAGVFSDTRPAFAQTQIDCPPPAGETLPADPRVTAQQVEDGSASLMDFALAVRDQFGQGTTTTPQRTLYVGCLIRQEGSVYRSGSTYLIQLRFDGRVFVHAKDMSLSGRQLRPAIYGAILRALGIDQATRVAFEDATTGDGGPFDVPGIPGASGYAAVYVSAKFGSPVVLLAGFDLNESHLVEEDIVHIEPAVTARDVVGRDTLKAFVTQAGEYILALAQQQNGDLLKAKNALRDPNGPWRHGPVYLYILDLTGNIILFHGAFPDLYELRPLIVTVQDVVTGEFILPQIIEAAKGNPEGGFVEYYFDDPTDDTDSADIPKVGYARVFTGSFQRRSDGTEFPINFIVGSGFYQSAGGAGELRGVLENPGPHSFQSGTGMVWGWVCEAEFVEIEIETAQGEVESYRAAYRMERLDTQERCGDVDNGFEMLFNWNRLGDGEHRVTAFVDGLELGRATVRVKTLGEEVLQGVVGECVAENFPHMGQSTRLEWQQTNQNFVITEVQ